MTGGLRVAGTFTTAAEKLPYLAKLGVNMIELMPVATFCDQADGWGYNPCAPYAVMNAFGGYKGLKMFVNAAASYGIGVMLDVVWNHADSGNILEKFDTYGGTAGNGIYFYEGSTTAETLWGPRPAYDTPQVVDYILGACSRRRATGGGAGAHHKGRGGVSMCSRLHPDVAV